MLIVTTIRSWQVSSFHVLATGILILTPIIASISIDVDGIIIAINYHSHYQQYQYFCGYHSYSQWLSLSSLLSLLAIIVITVSIVSLTMSLDSKYCDVCHSQRFPRYYLCCHPHSYSHCWHDYVCNRQYSHYQVYLHPSSVSSPWYV